MIESPKHLSRRQKKTSTVNREAARNRKVARVLVYFLAFLFVFALGFFVRSQTAFIASLGFPVEETLVDTKGSMQQKTAYDSLSVRVGEVEDILNDYSLDSYDVNDATGITLEAILKATGDPYALYFDDDKYANYIKETSKNTYAGIGVLFSDNNGKAYVIDVFQDSEAAAKGVRQGDIVSAIDGDGATTWTMAEVIKAISEKDGQEIVITWVRPATTDTEKGEEFTTTLTCQNYEKTNVTQALHESVGYVQISQITQNSSHLVEQAVKDLTAQGATSFVLDLRNNPGGYLTQAVDIASLFLQSGVVVGIEGVDGLTTKTATDVTITKAPVVVLVNEYTSAAAEVLAGALQDNQRAEIVGKTTLGKGSVQVVRELSFGGAIRYTAAYYKTPLGHDINNVGIVPDTVVGNSEDSDTQLLVAEDIAMVRS